MRLYHGQLVVILSHLCFVCFCSFPPLFSFVCFYLLFCLLLGCLFFFFASCLFEFVPNFLFVFMYVFVFVCFVFVCLFYLFVCFICLFLSFFLFFPLALLTPSSFIHSFHPFMYKQWKLDSHGQDAEVKYADEPMRSGTGR